MTIIVGLKLVNRVHTAEEFQRILSKYGCSIKTRIGLHSIQGGFCSPDGIILLEVIDGKILAALESELLKIDNIELQHMIFN